MASNKVYCVVGGTSGLGASVVKALSGSGSTVFVGGRTLPSSSSTPSSSPSTSITYKSLDVKSLKQSIAFADFVRTSKQVQENGLAGLVLTAGNFNFALSRSTTTEGIESTLALNALSKLAIINRLLPDLERVPDSRVVSVLAGGNGGPFKPDDIQLKSNYNCVSQAIQTGVLVDLFTVHLASLNTSPSSPKFFHMFPGLMNTNNPTNANLPFYVTYPLKFVLPILGRSPDTVATEVVTLLQSEEWKAKSGALVHPGLKTVKPYAKVWKECNDLIQEVINS
ncbi:hypothetical protein BCR33DRAFT_717903 [Rhizoclosmatium globosum]|uniref:NAD(P)-binding protein n=1 Tax=Rhizoclosmatium globosum TaxID=329046 RepID=A0A1Y2C814_9FUNG|nr:hypothetical protein BCR33DRAFT_717903 [Rhizoclosmatium globosum]|eukprot:ORY43169.1 hypothetical protein BCR33DRAFT_717903 [Rhizoclosmatium globosum]